MYTCQSCASFEQAQIQEWLLGKIPCLGPRALLLRAETETYFQKLKTVWITTFHFGRVQISWTGCNGEKYTRISYENLPWHTTACYNSHPWFHSVTETWKWSCYVQNCKNRISKVLNIRMLLRYHKAHLISNLTSSGSTPESEAGAPNKADIMARTSSVTWRKMNIICCFCDFIFLNNYLLLGSGSNHSATWPLLSQLAVHLEKGNTELLQNFLLMAIRWWSTKHIGSGNNR